MNPDPAFAMAVAPRRREPEHRPRALPRVDPDPAPRVTMAGREAGGRGRASGGFAPLEAVLSTPPPPPAQAMVIDLTTGRARPAMNRPPVLSSLRASWRGFQFEEYAGSELETREVALAKDTLLIPLTPSRGFEIGLGGEPRRFFQRSPGQVEILPAAIPMSVRAQDSGAFLAVTLDAGFIWCAADGLLEAGGLRLVPRLGVEDPLLREGGLALKGELESGNPGGRVYAEAIATMLVLQMVRHHGGSPLAVSGPERGLSQGRLREVVDFIQGQLAGDLSLPVLARVAGLSPFFFARQFKLATGLSPHQFVIRARVERAREILLSSDATLVETAQRVGFCDQSHFAAHFKRVHGVAPGSFLRRIGRRLSRP